MIQAIMLIYLIGLPVAFLASLFTHKFTASEVAAVVLFWPFVFVFLIMLSLASAMAKVIE